MVTLRAIKGATLHTVGSHFSTSSILFLNAECGLLAEEAAKPTGETESHADEHPSW